MAFVKLDKCPRWGFIEMTTSYGQQYVMETSCKTWRCPVCRYKRISYVKLMMERGCSILGESYLITLTLKAGDPWTHDAEFVARAWTSLLRRLKRRSPQLTWFKVVEATRKGTPHLHLIVGGIGKRIPNCAGKFPPFSVDWINEECREDCLIHEWGRIWWDNTGAFVVHAVEVYSAAGAAKYLGKYLVKGMGADRARLEALGYTRRFTMARDWPRGQKMQLLGTKKGAWEATEVVPRYFRREEMLERVRRSRRAGDCQSVGDRLSATIVERRNKKAQRMKVERMENALL